MLALVTREVRFRIGDVFQPGDTLAEWIVTIALALNDFTLTGRLAFSSSDYGPQSYGGRIGIAHFREAGGYLDQMESHPAVQSFVHTNPSSEPTVCTRTLSRGCALTASSIIRNGDLGRER